MGRLFPGATLRTQLSLVIVFVALVTVALISFMSNTLINRQFEAYIAERQMTRAETIADSVGQYYNGLTNEWDLPAIHVLSMYSLYDGYIIKVYGAGGGLVWDTENHDMAQCRQIIGEISERMADHGASGDFASVDYDIRQDGQKIGSVSVRFYGPFFLSESDFSFLASLNSILLAVGALSLVFSFAAGWLLAKRIARPIRKTVEIATQIASGHYDIRFESQTGIRELRGLVSAVNHLAKALASQKQLRKRLTADVAHELRTPLTTLGSHLEAMIEQVWEPTPERLKSCHEEILRLGKMAEDLERLERAEDGDLSPDKSPVDITALTRTVCDNFAAELANKRLRLEIEAANVVVSADKDRIGGVIANLVSNAVKYTPEGGSIRVFIAERIRSGSGAGQDDIRRDTDLPPGDVFPETVPLNRDIQDAGIWIIEDTGPGIPEHELPHIFERFYRADQSRNRDTGGAGIGLAIVKSVTEAHGGTVTAANRRSGGARFTVVLPKISSKKDSSKGLSSKK
jgi:signal transduction histidine kinase